MNKRRLIPSPLEWAALDGPGSTSSAPRSGGEKRHPVARAAAGAAR